LRPRKVEDGVIEYRWRTDPDLCRLDATIPLEFSLAEFLDRYSVELEYPGLTYTLAIDAIDGQHIGECSLFNLDFTNSAVEIGIMIGEKEYWGKGYGLEALHTFVSHIFQASNIDRIVLRTLDWNLRAQRCFEKCGFKSFGTHAGGDHSFLLMEITRPPSSSSG
jgi:RimJ/RimL family protein N-acetyltransferase